MILTPIIFEGLKDMADKGGATVHADDHVDIQEEGMNETIDITIDAEGLSAEEAVELDQGIKNGEVGGAAAGNAMKQKAGGCPKCG